MLQSPELVERWRITQQEYLTDIQMVLANQALDQLRLQVQQEMMQFLVAFLNRSITLKEFNARFQQKTQGSWNVFHMRGTSGGMYLNKLVKYIEDETLTSHLRSVLRLPEDTREGQRHMQELTHYFEHLIAQQKGLRSQLQPARIPFLLSAWWHLQDAHYWPIFFPLLHLMLMDEDSQSEQDKSEHTQIQWLLAKIGHQVGCEVWIAANDHSKSWNGERLGDLSLKALPPLVDSASRRVINLIDVLWLRGDDVIAAYEIEHSTSISSGLLRLYDLDALCSTNIMHLCVVIPHPSLKRFQGILARPAFQRLNMQKRCLIIQEETLLEHAEHILRWASSPMVIAQLALHTESS